MVAVVGAGCLWLGERGARAIERLLVERVGNGLEVLGIDWAEIDADGLRLELAGHAPDAEMHALALETARSVAPFALVVDRATVAQAPSPERVPIQLQLMRDEGSLVMTGRFHGHAMRAALAESLAAARPDLEIRDLTGVNAAKPGPGWGPELRIAALAVARLDDAYVRIEPGAVRIDGVAADAAERRRLTDELLRLGGEAVRLTLDLRQPPRAVAPFIFTVATESSGAVGSAICHARNAEEAARLEAALGQLGVPPGERRCVIALGGPDGDWVAAVEAGLAALGAMSAGALRVEYRDVVLEAADGVSAAAADRARTVLERALPRGYRLAAAPPGAAAAGGSGEPEYWLRIRRSADGAELDGLVPSETARRMLVTYAEARLGPAQARIGTASAEAPVPGGWEPAMLAALDALAGLASGEAALAPGRVRLTGRVAAPAEAGRVHRAAVEAAPEGYAVETALTVDLPAAVAALPLSAARCAAVLNEAIGRQPIGFAPGEAVFEPGSEAVLDRIAAVLGRCDGARVEIGGHTDSRGPEALNQRLSLRRAEAVLDALIARGVPLAMLSARGFGEAEPVASNDTEEGRARNRRIAFEAIDCTTRQAGC